MTDQQQALFAEPVKLTARQQAAVDYLAAHDGVPADEIGAALHERRGKHDAGDRCGFCATEGRSVLKSKAVRPLVTYRRHEGGRLYLLRDPATRSKPLSGLIATSDPDPATNPFAGL